MEKNNKGLYILLGIMFALVIVLSGYVLYDKVLSNQVEDNIEENNSNDLEVVSEIPNDIYGTYYNNVKYGGKYTGEYFTINSSGTAIVVHSTCGEGLAEPITINYRFYVENDILILSFDINGDSNFVDKYTVYKGIYGYQFKHNNISCTDEHNSYYVSKLD